MFRFLPYILKNLRGHGVRTIMTVAGAALLMFLYSFVTSIQQGLDHLTDPSRQDNRLIVFQAYRFCPSTSELPYPLYETEIRKVSGVRDVLPIKVKVNNCRASLDSVVFHGVPPEGLQRLRKLQLVEGDWKAFAQRRDGGALAGAKLAERRGLRVGKPFTIAGVTVNIEGIFTSDQAAEENLIYTHLPFLQTQQGARQDVTVTLYEVHVDDPSRQEAVAAAIDAHLREGGFPVQTDTKPQKTYYRRALADLVDLITFTRWLGYVCVGVVCVLVANSVIMAAQDRIKEHGVLQTIGFTGSRIFRLMVGESLIISVAGGVIGVAGCYAWLRTTPLSVATEGVSVDFLATPELVMLGLGLSVVVGVLAGVVPAWQAARREIVQSFR